MMEYLQQQSIADLLAGGHLLRMHAVLYTLGNISDCPRPGDGLALAICSYTVMSLCDMTRSKVAFGTNLLAHVEQCTCESHALGTEVMLVRKDAGAQADSALGVFGYQECSRARHTFILWCTCPMSGRCSGSGSSIAPSSPASGSSHVSTRATSSIAMYMPQAALPPLSPRACALVHVSPAVAQQQACQRGPPAARAITRNA